MRCDDYGAFGLAWKSATNLLGSFERAQRHARVLSNVSTYEVEMTDAGAYMHLHREGERHLGMRISNEATIASITTISREVSTNQFTPVAIYFKHPAPKSIASHEAYFGCRVHFNSDKDALLVSSDTLKAFNHLGDETIAQFFDTHLQTEIAQLEDEYSLERQVRKQVSQSLSEGVPMISDIARKMGMSGRTLQRRLAELGCPYKTLVDQSRRELTEYLLKKTDYSLAEVAFMTGFSEQSAFNRAFKRWEGQTPRSFRIKS
jgi:AraC-like DNA-binding protein